MDIRVWLSGAPCTPALAAHVRRNLHRRLLHSSDRIDRVEVRLGGAGHRGVGHDMYCLMQVHLSGASAATVVNLGADMNSTIESAAERVGRLAGARLEAVKVQPAGRRAAGRRPGCSTGGALAGFPAGDKVHS